MRSWLVMAPSAVSLAACCSCPAPPTAAIVVPPGSTVVCPNGSPAVVTGGVYRC